MGQRSTSHTPSRSLESLSSGSLGSDSTIPQPAPAEHTYNANYTGEYLSRIAFPMGGIGAGMLCLEGTGALSHVSLRNAPDVFNEPCIFSALWVKGNKEPAANDPTSRSETANHITRVLEGPVPTWKLFGPGCTGNGGFGKTYGLPRFAAAEFVARFPYASVRLTDRAVPLQVQVTGWSPFIPGKADASSLPVAALEFRFHNLTDAPIEAVYSFNARNFMTTRTKGDSVTRSEEGLIFRQPGSDAKPVDEGAFCVESDQPNASVDCAWFRGGWFDPLTIQWEKISKGDVTEGAPYTEGPPSPGGSILVPFTLNPGEEKRITVRLSWYVPNSDLRVGPTDDDCGCDDGSCSPAPKTYKPWYAGRFRSIEEVAAYWRDNYSTLNQETQTFTEAFYDTDLPPEVIEAVAANLTILKSPTVLRQADGRLWAWEGCHDNAGCCSGSCTHVWNYAQAIPHLFPDLERTLRETEFGESQDERGHQTFRALIPIRPAQHDFHAAADGQLGGIMKVFREWRISGDTEWLRSLWPRVQRSLDYAIDTWDPDHTGMLVEPHHNTYDIEFWGPDGMCTSFYLGALEAACLMGQALGDDVAFYRELLDKGVAAMESDLWNGEYFFQRVQWEGVHAGSPLDSPGGEHVYGPSEARRLLDEQGPKYQYGTGCLSDGILGAWLASVCGVPGILNPEKVRSHLHSVHKHNLKHDLSTHVNCQRPTYAAGDEGGLLLCTWPQGGRPSLPFVYSDEVWTGIEYQVASHLMFEGMVEEGLEIVRVARKRYDGRVRNPFNEYECGHWYARAMASYALLFGLTGIRYDAVEGKLHVAPRIAGDFRSFLSTATGFGVVGVKDGAPFVDVRSGQIDVHEVVYTPFGG